MRHLFVPVDWKRERARRRNRWARGITTVLLAAMLLWLTFALMGWVPPYPQELKGGGLFILGGLAWGLCLPWMKWWKEYR